MSKLLILGGTAEARELALRITQTPSLMGLDVVTSLAGRTRNPRRPFGQLRCGGFGGVEGLIEYLRSAAIDLVIDATHPFAERISAAALAACETTRRPRLVLRRPSWQARWGDRWHSVADLAEAARTLPSLGRRVLVTSGHRDLAALRQPSLAQHFFLLRLIERPLTTVLPFGRCELRLARGPFSETAELALLRHYAIDVLICKNSGGTAGYGKLSAARQNRIPVLMLTPPAPPCGPLSETVDAALAWLQRRV